MKKRVKLLTTIASLCLAVALMAFGVYAATTASITVNSTVSFDVGSHLDGTITVTAYYSADGSAIGDEIDSDSVTVVATTETKSDTASITLDAATLTQETPYVLYVVTFVPTNGVDATVSITKPTIPEEGYASAAAVEGTADANTATTWVQATALTASNAGGAVSFVVSLA